MAVFTQTTTFANGQTADGGQVNTEIINLGNSVNNIVNDQISTSAAIAISKTALGTYTAWTTWSPTLGASADFATKVARYCQIGKMVFVQVELYGTVTTGAAAQFNISLPVTPKGYVGALQRMVGTSYWWDNDSGGSGAYRIVKPYTYATSSVMIFSLTPSTDLNGSNLAANDEFYISAAYEAA